MKEQGVIIFRDGTKKYYGHYLCPDEEGYTTSPKHKDDFEREVLPSFEFQLSGLVYDKDLTFYQNSLNFSLEGAMAISNNQSSISSETKVLSYMPMEPTEEQLNSLKEDEVLQNIQIQDVYEFQSEDWNDYEEYVDFNDYINKKTKKL